MVIADPKVAAMDICFFRTFVMFLVACFLIRYHKKDVKQEVEKFDKSTKKAVLIRLVSGICSQTLMIFATKMLPITIANLIFNINPFWITLMGFIVLKEKIGILDFLGLVGSFAGVVIIILSKKVEEDD